MPMNRYWNYIWSRAGWIFVLGALALSGCSSLTPQDDGSRPWGGPGSGAASPDWIGRSNGSF